MPYARCSVCHDSFHLAVRGSPVEWEREHVRERAADGTPLLKCVRCWVELRPGHQVTVRALPQELAETLSIGQQGVVESAAMPEQGKVLVRFGPTSIDLKREELFYVVGQPPVA